MTSNGIEGMERIEYKLNENKDINLMDAVLVLVAAIFVFVWLYVKFYKTLITA
ncbi:MAG: hypothetical protein JZD40_05900 [Sulfolobus sp.]|nr:hypothetical protein [Sulfolobus sp.]